MNNDQLTFSVLSLLTSTQPGYDIEDIIKQVKLVQDELFNEKTKNVLSEDVPF